MEPSTVEQTFECTFLLFSIIQGLYIIKRNDEEELEEMEAQEE